MSDEIALRLAQIRGRLSAATQDAWEARQYQDPDPNPANWNVNQGMWSVVASDGTSICDITDAPERDNALLIANAPVDLEWACDEITRLAPLAALNVDGYKYITDATLKAHVERDEARAALLALLRAPLSREAQRAALRIVESTDNLSG